MKNKKAFTLIELVSVLLILAILALIVTPLVLNIIRKARTAADKRSIDAYGRSIELAVADYLLENGTFPTSIEELTIEYSGDRVECATAGLQPDDTSVYLANCKVNGRDASSETYKAYNIGDEVTYNNVDYYVIKDSDETESTITLLKATPLTAEEVNTYGEGHVNMYTLGNQGTADDHNGYGGMAYYSSTSCGYDSNDELQDSGCTNDYEDSEVKYVVDLWAQLKVPDGLEEVRLITIEEVSSLGYEWMKTCPTCDEGWVKTENTPTWLYDGSYGYWTMSPKNDSTLNVWFVSIDGGFGNSLVYKYDHGSYRYNVRPVIKLKKSALN